MTYTPINFKNREVRNPRTYIMKDASGTETVVTLADNFGGVTEEGTALNAYHMNHIEDGIVGSATTELDNLTEAGYNKLNERYMQNTGDIMNGVLTVQGDPSYAYMQNTSYTRSGALASSTDVYSGKLVFQWSDDKGYTGTVENRCSSNAAYTQLAVTKDGSTYTHIGVALDSSGNAWGYAPTYTTYTDSSNKIATTKFVHNCIPSSATSANYGMPNYSSSSTVSSGTTISKNGWLRVKLKCDYGKDVFVRVGSSSGQILAGIDWTRTEDYSGQYFWYFVPVAKGNKIYFTGETSYIAECKFFPCIGG